MLARPLYHYYWFELAHVSLLVLRFLFRFPSLAGSSLDFSAFSSSSPSCFSIGSSGSCSTYSPELTFSPIPFSGVELENSSSPSALSDYATSTSRWLVLFYFSFFFHFHTSFLSHLISISFRKIMLFYFFTREIL